MRAAFSFGTSLQAQTISQRRSRCQGWSQSSKVDVSVRGARYAVSNRTSRCTFSCILDGGASSSVEPDEGTNSIISRGDNSVNTAAISSLESACAACNGRGYTDCPDCEGEGFIEASEELWRTCERCRGKGAAACTFCTAGSVDPQGIPWMGIDFEEDMPLGPAE